MRYPILLLDADGTLLDFDRAEEQALKLTFQRHSHPFDGQTMAAYQEINYKLWTDFENGLISKSQILSRRFRQLFVQIGIQDELPGFEEEYQLALGEGGFLLPDAFSVCRQLYEEGCRLYILTNGVEATQLSRLERSGLNPLLSGVFVSETTGYQKPQKEYFDYVRQRIPGYEEAQALMVGDSLNSDIRGGCNAGVDTCWYNPAGKGNNSGLRPDYEIRKLTDLINVARKGEL